MFAADDVFSIEEIDNKLLQMLENIKHIYFDSIEGSACRKTQEMCKKIEEIIISTNQKNKIKSAKKLIDKMRVIKSKAEIELMKQSALVAANAMREVMQAVSPGLCVLCFSFLFLFFFFFLKKKKKKKNKQYKRCVRR